ncbi:hypothetical protein C3L33_02848, partial [Rhododendron williamsianum]
MSMIGSLDDGEDDGGNGGGGAGMVEPKDGEEVEGKEAKLEQWEMGIWTLLEGCLLLANALAILNEERFLVPRRWSFQEFSGVRRNSMKGQLIGLIYAVQYMRILLMVANVVIIVVKLVSGWLNGRDSSERAEVFLFQGEKQLVKDYNRVLYGNSFADKSGFVRWF